MITVVSGIPRSGTSLMMQMIAAGGMPVLTDGLRSADENNPRGYKEWEAAKSLPQTPEIIAAAEGKVVKVISSLLFSLPKEHEYRVIFMRRPIEQIVASQNKMLERLGQKLPNAPQRVVTSAFNDHLKKVQKWLSEQPNIAVLYVDYAAVLANPHQEAEKIAQFVGYEFDLAAMIAEVEPSLHRERSKTTV